MTNRPERKRGGTEAEFAEWFWAMCEPVKGGHRLWTGGQHNQGYGVCYFRGKTEKTHRIAYILTHGDIPEGRGINHKRGCHHKNCAAPEHLYAGDQAQNAADRVADGRANPARGKATGTAKLSPGIVREIRRLDADGWTNRALGERYGVSGVAIHMVTSGKTWGHVK